MDDFESGSAARWTTTLGTWAIVDDGSKSSPRKKTNCKSPSGTHYLLALGSDDKLILRKRVNSTSTGATAIGSGKALSVNVGQWYDTHFELVGTSLEGCVGDVCVSGTDASIASGSVAVGTVNTSARFDDVRVAAP